MRLFIAISPTDEIRKTLVKTQDYRKSKEALPVLAICYDFDKTLTPDDMQAQGYWVTINLKQEMIEDIMYDVGLAGNG